MKTKKYKTKKHKKKNTLQLLNNIMFERKSWGDFPRATQPGKLFRATGLEITFCRLIIGNHARITSTTTDRDIRPQAPC